MSKSKEIKFDKDGIPMLCLDKISVDENDSGITIDFTKTIEYFGYFEQNWEYNYKTKEWEEVDE